MADRDFGERGAKKCVAGRHGRKTAPKTTPKWHPNAPLWGPRGKPGIDLGAAGPPREPPGASGALMESIKKTLVFISFFDHGPAGCPQGARGGPRAPPGAGQGGHQKRPKKGTRK